MRIAGLLLAILTGLVIAGALLVADHLGQQYRCQHLPTGSGSYAEYCGAGR